ncbi:polysaccharide deacetylase family protein [Brevundimonas sp.]|uniref:polysaccharide deacetylase family protein n=1 Tax=Brevundimonas sp. TaxID=1871086 RepID=UPI0035B44B1F
MVRARQVRPRLSHLAAAALAGLLLVSSAHAQVQAQGPVDRRVAVTFDDLPYQASDAVLCDPEATLALTRDFLAMLAPLDSRATGFVNEGRVCDAARPELVAEVVTLWLDAGLLLGNHSFSHPDLGAMTADEYLADVDRGAEITRPLVEARGDRLVWFRHPFLKAGETPDKKAAVEAGLAERGYRVATVTLDNNDWMYADLYRRAEAAGDAALMRRLGEAYVAHMAEALDHYEPYSAEMNGGVEPPQVLLLHANALNRDWYPRIHDLFLRRGYAFVSLDEAQADPIYDHPDTYAGPNGISWLHRWRLTAGERPRYEPRPPAWVIEMYEAR